MASQVKTRIEPATQAPVPSQAPTLVTKIDCGRRRADRRWVINFERQAQPALGLVLTDATLHGLIDALARRVNNAGWNLQPLALEAVASANLQIATQLH